MRLVRYLISGLALCAMVVISSAAWAAVVAPTDNDTYNQLVARAEADDPTVDFRALRFAWLGSDARARAPPAISLKQSIIAAVTVHDIKGARVAAENALSFNYADIYAHKTRREACQLSGDGKCVRHERFVEHGLLTSIMGGKDGQTAATAWEVASVEEEYFLLSFAGVRLGDQSLMMVDHRQYDHFHVADQQGRPLDVYFDITVYWQKTYGGPQ